MKKIIMSLAMIAAVGAIAVGATTSFFSDTETSVGNTFTAGTIDISVDGENPWSTSWENYLDKPCQVNYMTFTIKNAGENPAKIWKHLYNVETNGGDSSYCGVASSEPEYEEGGGIVTYNTSGALECDSSHYVEEHNLAAYMVYDMSVCTIGVDGTCDLEGEDPSDPNNDGYPVLGTGWKVIIDEDQQIRVDNISCNWIYLGTLQPGEEMIVSQSYHLMAWDDAGVETITNWAQGDVMKFDIELEARQLTAPAPLSPNAGTLILENKDDNWDPITDNTQGVLTYNTSGLTFDYTLTADGLQDTTEYCLIYYYDPYPGSGGFDVECGLTTDTAGHVYHVGSQDIGSIPVSGDGNYPVGAKLWLVPASDYDPAANQMTAWNQANYLFEMNLIKYDKN